MAIAPLALLLAAAASPAHVTALLRALVETDTSHATGSCTAAAEQVATAMRLRGFPQQAIHRFGDTGRPQDGGLLARVEGSDRTLKPLLFVAHIDAVAADPKDWTHPPLKLTETGGYFYGRGVADNKAAAALLVDLAVEVQSKAKRRRSFSIALTCGEETPGAFNGAEWLARAGRSLIDPAQVLVLSGGAKLDQAARLPAAFTIAVGEKVQQNFRLEARGTASHASLPHPDNAIVTLATAITRLSAHVFPSLRDAPPSTGPAAPFLRRTTCVTTVIDTGRQANTIAPSASANVNCRLVPGTPITAVQAELAQLFTGLSVTMAAVPPIGSSAPPPPHPAQLLAAARAAARKLWPRATVSTATLTGATDARHFNAVGIPAYGVAILAFEQDGSRVHAPDERVRVDAVSDARTFLRSLADRLLRSAADAASGSAPPPPRTGPSRHAAPAGSRRSPPPPNRR